MQLHHSGQYVVRQAIQLHGGIGITDEHDVGLYFKRMLALNAIFGDAEYHVVEKFGATVRGYTAGPSGGSNIAPLACSTSMNDAIVSNMLTSTS